MDTVWLSRDKRPGPWLAGKAQGALDEVLATLYGAKVPARARGAITRQVGYVSRVVVQAVRVPHRGMFGETTVGDALDDTIHELVQGRRMYWVDAMPKKAEPPTMYRLRHRSGIPFFIQAVNPVHYMTKRLPRKS